MTRARARRECACLRVGCICTAPQVREMTRLCNKKLADDAEVAAEVTRKLHEPQSGPLVDDRGLIGLVKVALSKALLDETAKSGMAAPPAVDLLGCTPTKALLPRENFPASKAKGPSEKLETLASDLGELHSAVSSLCHGGQRALHELEKMVRVCGRLAYTLCPAESDGHDGPLHQAVCHYIEDRVALLRGLQEAHRPAVEPLVAAAWTELFEVAASLVVAREHDIIDAHKAATPQSAAVRSETRLCAKDSKMTTP